MVKKKADNGHDCDGNHAGCEQAPYFKLKSCGWRISEFGVTRAKPIYDDSCRDDAGHYGACEKTAYESYEGHSRPLTSAFCRAALSAKRRGVGVGQQRVVMHSRSFGDHSTDLEFPTKRAA